MKPKPNTYNLIKKTSLYIFFTALIITIFTFSKPLKAQGPLSGMYMIDQNWVGGGVGGATSTFNSLNQAIDTLIAYGISGPVIFDIAPGIYTEQIVIPAISGTSPTNTITFQSNTGNDTDVVLQYTGTQTAYYTVKLNHSNNIVFKKMTIKAIGTSYARAIEIWDGCYNITIDSCRISTTTAGSGNEFTCIYSEPNNNSQNGGDHDNLFINNIITGGGYGIYWRGDYSVSKANNAFVGNIINGFVYTGIYISEANDEQIVSNFISDSGSSTIKGIYINPIFGQALID